MESGSRKCNNNSALLMGGKSRSNLEEEITPQIRSLDPLFTIFIDLCSCYSVGSLTAQANQLIDA